MDAKGLALLGESQTHIQLQIELNVERDKRRGGTLLLPACPPSDSISRAVTRESQILVIPLKIYNAPWSPRRHTQGRLKLLLMVDRCARLRLAVPINDLDFVVGQHSCQHG